MHLRRKGGFGEVHKRRRGAAVTNTKNLIGSSDDPLYGLAIEDEDFEF